MQKFNSKKPIYPVLGLFVAILTLFVGLVFSSNENIIFFYIGIYILHIVFGNYKACLVVIPFTVIMASFFGLTTYVVAQDVQSTTEAVYRSFAVCLAVIPGLSIATTEFIRNLRQLKLPKGVTLGMLITLNFIPLFRKEMIQIRSAMKTRGAVSIFNPKVVYRSFLIPLVIRIVNISETLSLSVETRGFTLEKSETSVYQPISFKFRDFMFISLFIIIAVGVVML